MPESQSYRHSLLPLRVAGVDLELSTAHREGRGAPILFLHGFGSTKEDYAGLPFVAYDAPGSDRNVAPDRGLSRPP